MSRRCGIAAIHVIVEKSRKMHETYMWVSGTHPAEERRTPEKDLNALIDSTRYVSHLFAPRWLFLGYFRFRGAWRRRG